MAGPTRNRFGRRGFLRRGGIAAAATAVPFSFVYGPVARAASPYGELVPDPDGVLDLPQGFSYKILETRGENMSDGYRVPGRADGMGAFAGPGGAVILMRNHELGAGDLFDSPYQLDDPQIPDEAYTDTSMGGVTRLVLDGATFGRVSSNLVLVGTTRNCAGGVSPWGWLSCEENTDAGHGYVFLCPIDAETVQHPQRLDVYGRCNHEAVAVDPSSNTCYITEDRGDSSLYRFVPDSPDDPHGPGKFQALAVTGQSVFQTTNMQVGEIVDIEWIDIDEPTPADDGLRGEAQGKGAAVFVRGEGIWFFDGCVYVCSTSGGPQDAGQIFKLTDMGDVGALELIAMSVDKGVLEMPDNITIAPWDELFIAEDGDGDNFIRGVTADGEVYPFARNAISDSEFAGVCFSPDGKAMFVNIQSDGITLVITGPFPTVDDGGTDGGTSDSGGSDTDEPGTTGDDSAGSDSATSAGPGSDGASDAGGDDTDTDSSGMADSDGGDEGCACAADPDGDATLSSVALTAALAVGVRATTRRTELTERTPQAPRGTGEGDAS